MARQVALVVGASRGIGRQIAIDLAKAGYAGETPNSPRDTEAYHVLTLIYEVVVAAKSTRDAAKANPFPPNPNSPQSTISTVEREIKEAGGEATAIAVDVRDYESVQKLVMRTIEACCSSGTILLTMR